MYNNGMKQHCIVNNTIGEVIIVAEDPERPNMKSVLVDIDGKKLWYLSSEVLLPAFASVYYNDTRGISL